MTGRGEAQTTTASPRRSASSAMTNTLILRIVASNALRDLLQDLLPELERLAGCCPRIEYGSSIALDKHIHEGERADLALLTSPTLAKLENEGIILAGSSTDLASSDIGMAVKAGSPAPVIDTVEQFKDTLLHAQSVAYSESGASGVYTQALLQRLGIAEQVEPKARILSFGLTGYLAARGEVQYALQQVCELRQVAGLYIVRLPAQIQLTSVFAAGVFRDSSNAKTAQALIAHLASADVVDAFLRHGFQRSQAMSHAGR